MLTRSALFFANLPPQALQQKAVLSWSPDDVSQWIKAIGFSEYSAKFHKNAVGGQELITVTSSDLKALGVTALGHQKAILAKVASLHADSEETAAKAVAPGKSKSAGAQKESEADLSSVDDHSETNSSSATNAANRLELVVVLGDARRSVVVKRSHDMDRVLSKLEDIFGFSVEIKVKGQIVPDATKWSDIVSRHATVDPLEIAIEREDPNKVHKEERAMLQGLVDACFVIDKMGTILFQNFAAEDMLGYDSAVIVGTNIRELTPPEIRAKHDSYLKRYLETGNAKVIGSGRQVQAIHKKGHEVSCWLSVTEQKKASGRHTFMGTLHEIKSRDVGQSGTKFAVLDGISEAVLVINSAGVMQFMNARMEKLLGYTKEILGRNVSTIMPEPYASSHDSFIRSYLKTGLPKVMGRGGRIVVAKHANGSVVPISLEVDECILEGQRYFVGVMQPKDSTRKKKTTLLERTRAVVDQLAVASIVISPNGTVQAFNQPAAALFGYEPTEVVSQNVRMLMNDADAEKHDSYLLRHMQTGENRIVGKFRVVQAKASEKVCFYLADIFDFCLDKAGQAV